MFGTSSRSNEFKVCALNEGQRLQFNHNDNICLVFKLQVDFIKQDLFNDLMMLNIWRPYKKKGKVVNSASSRTHQLPPCCPFVIIKQKNV